MKGFALGLAMKQRRKATRNSPIQGYKFSFLVFFYATGDKHQRKKYSNLRKISAYFVPFDVEEQESQGARSSNCHLQERGTSDDTGKMHVSIVSNMRIRIFVIISFRSSDKTDSSFIRQTQNAFAPSSLLLSEQHS